MKRSSRRNWLARVGLARLFEAKLFAPLVSWMAVGMYKMKAPDEPKPGASNSSGG